MTDWGALDKQLITGVRDHTGRRIIVKFVDFWPGFYPSQSPLLGALTQRFHVLLDGEWQKPDVLFYSAFGDTHRDFKGSLKIFYTGENIRPPMGECDLALSFDYLDDPRHMRFPLYVEHVYRYWRQGLIPNFCELFKPTHWAAKETQSTKAFCSAIVGNPRCRERTQFIAKMIAAGMCDSWGSHLNTTGQVLSAGAHAWGDKLALLQAYRYNIAFENSSHPGYLTEKIVDPMLAGCVPIYWGDPEVIRDFNSNAFAWVHRPDIQGLDYVRHRESEYLTHPKLQAGGERNFEIWRLAEFIESAM